MPSNPVSPSRRSLTPEKSKLIIKSPHVYEIIAEVISSTDVEKLSPNLIEFRIICGTFCFESDLVTQFNGKKLTIFANYIFVCQSCTIDLSGIPQSPFSVDAGQDSYGKGRDGLDGSAGESGGNLALICKIIQFENDSILTIISNGADGMNGQNGGNGGNGKNGKDATEHSFSVKGFDWRMHCPLCAENREMYEKFDLKLSQNCAAHSKVTTDDGLAGYVFVQSHNNEEYGFMLVKGEEPGLPGKPGGYGGFGGEGGLPGKIQIQCDQNEHPENIKIVKNSGKNGKNGIGGLNGSKGRGGGDFWKYHLTNWQEPACFGQAAPTKFKLFWGEQSEYSIFDNEKSEFVHVEEVSKIAEPTTEKTSNNFLPKRNKSSVNKAYPKTSIDVDEIIADHSQYLKKCEGGFISRIKQPLTNLLSNTFH